MSVFQARKRDHVDVDRSRRAPSVALEGVGKRYGNNPALDGVSLEVPAGTFVVLLGPSGSGKTTLLRCLAGIERVSSGRIAINGSAVADRDVHLPPERRDLGMVFQDYALWPHLTAQQNVEFALRRRHLAKAESQARAREMLARVGLVQLAGRYPNELSGGEQQRVALARALVANTGLLLFDEPLSNLDANLREQLRVEIATLARESGATVVYITHDQAEAFALADLIGVLQGGRLVQLATAEELYRRPASAFVARFTGLSGELEARAEEDGPSVDLSLRVDGPVPARLRAQAGDALRAGQRCRLLIRPSAIRLVAAGSQGSQLTGRVADVAFRGRGYDHAIAVGDAQLVGVHDERRWERGQPVGLELDRSGCFAFAGPSAEGATVALPVPSRDPRPN